MSSSTKSTVEMSLDDIIKANKRKDKGASKAVGGKGKKSMGVLKRGKMIGKQPQKGRLQKVKASNAIKSGTKRVMNKPNKTTAVATKKLVQKLVKKALAQSNTIVRNTVRTRQSVQRPKFRGGRILKKVVVNRLKINPRSRVISRQRANVEQLIAVRGRGQVRYNQNFEAGPVVRRVNYAPNVITKPVIVRAMPRTVFVQQRVSKQVPAFRTSNVMQGRSTVRDHISRLRGSASGRQVPQIVYVERPQQRRRNVQQQVVFQPQRRVTNRQPPQRQQRRSNFSGQQQYKNDPFFEPPNFLQRVPVQGVPQSRGGRRF